MIYVEDLDIAACRESIDGRNVMVTNSAWKGGRGFNVRESWSKERQVAVATTLLRLWDSSQIVIRRLSLTPRDEGTGG
jgi:hypothetical protein